MSVKLGCKFILSILIINVTYDYIYIWTLHGIPLLFKLYRLKDIMARFFMSILMSSYNINIDINKIS